MTSMHVIPHLKIIAACILSLTFAENKTESSPDGIRTEKERPVHKIQNIGEAAEAYFSPDGKSLICNAKLNDDDVHHVHTLSVDRANIRRSCGKGEDACSFFFPGGNRLIYTSTKDNPHLPKGDWSGAKNHPQGAELCACDLDGSNPTRLTFNEHYDAEVSVSPDGQWTLFGRQING